MGYRHCYWWIVALVLDSLGILLPLVSRYVTVDRTINLTKFALNPSRGKFIRSTYAIILFKRVFLSTDRDRSDLIFDLIRIFLVWLLQLASNYGNSSADTSERSSVNGWSKHSCRNLSKNCLHQI
jgi:hypothetical protein